MRGWPTFANSAAKLPAHRAMLLLRRRLAVTSSSAAALPSITLLLHHRYQQNATFVDVKPRYIRDRGLDHAVEKEKHLLPFHALKDLLLLQNSNNPSPSSTSLPLASISENRNLICFPFRPIDFVRSFPSAFLELPPPDKNSQQPIISPTDELVRLHGEEMSIYDSCKAEAADRLLRLIMLTRRKKVPLLLIDRLRWDLGLPHDYAKSVLPEFPDYFQVLDDREVELVCWNKDLAVSEMEKLARRSGSEYEKGAPLAFKVQYPTGFIMNKNVKKWMEEWQKLPYMSPYDDGGAKLDKSSMIGEKWAIGVMHELLNLFVPKKTEKENLLLLGEHVELRPSFRKAIMNYPGIFYVSYRNMSQTVVLRDAYKRDLPVELHPLMEMRFKYIHLMHKGKEDEAAPSPRDQKKAAVDFGSDVDDEIDDDDDEDEFDDSSDEFDFDSELENDDKVDAAMEPENSALKETVAFGKNSFKTMRTRSDSANNRRSTERRLKTRKVDFTVNRNKNSSKGAPKIREKADKKSSRISTSGKSSIKLPPQIGVSGTST